ncbi:MAG: pyrroloquinoline quinone biosynthesis protein PqqE [Candidatus Methanofastidiosum methylothiophilum]|uniref:Pyrroloquinoline quinone biosynthesis protein PqqE n=1 Tax=Candidatus Methanofastidiosum methylothiophilum TaxID=1705564 RepID=A0A150IQJ1_9EURY|nr:MAG: pyrroloquinoline quinone biosynthesis protein PqqE [Candidatus Methanofastidiosum methylthiophilus]
MIKNKLMDIGLYSLTINPLIKYSINEITTKCTKCENTVLEQIINSIETDEYPKMCRRCKLLFHFYMPWIPILRLFGFAVSRKSLKTVPTFSEGYSLNSYTGGVHSVLKGINTFGLKKPLTFNSPVSVILELTRYCNLNCSYCYVNTFNFDSNKNQNQSDLTTEKWLKALDTLKEAGVLSLVFSGGEPLLRDDFFTIAEYANKKDFSTSLATNGTLLDRDMANNIKESGINYVEISLFSSIRGTNDIHRKKDSFKKSINAIKFCKEQGLTVGLSLTLTSLVKGEVSSFLELAKNTGADACIFLNYVSSTKGNDPLTIDNGEKEKILTEILNMRKEYDKYFRKIVVLQAPEISQLHFEKQNNNELMQIGFTKFDKSGWGKYIEYVGGCSAGRFLLAISNEGTIMPCPFLRMDLGNILDGDLDSIWKNSDALNQMRDRNNWEGKCGTCKYKVVCGGCRARAYIKSNNILAEDPSCSFPTF